MSREVFRVQVLGFPGFSVALRKGALRRAALMQPISYYGPLHACCVSVGRDVSHSPLLVTHSLSAYPLYDTIVWVLGFGFTLKPCQHAHAGSKPHGRSDAAGVEHHPHPAALRSPNNQCQHHHQCRLFRPCIRPPSSSKHGYWLD